MADVTFTLTGSFLNVRAEMALRVLGGPLSFRFTVLQPVSLNDVWNAIRKELANTFGISLPAISDGPWSIIFDNPITISFWVTPQEQAGGVACYLELTLTNPIHIGGTTHLGPVTVTLEPDIEVMGLYLGYDKAQGGLSLRAKISTPTTTGPAINAGDAPPAGQPKTQIVRYPFPLPPQNSVGVFKLRYLGLGQRVGPNPVINSNDPLAAIFDELESQLVGSDPATILTRLANNFYHPDRGWFIAAHISLRGFDLRVLFNDPAMYGLEISVADQPITPFSGFLFEILYQKLGPNLGVYYGALTLPYALRRIPLEAVILILPGFSIWVYTNGDFKVNVGWPLGNSSIGVEVGILVGQAGFHFAKLRSGDDPGAQPSVDYNPILAFGIGIRVYAAVSFNASIFSASLSVTVSATLQGVLAWRSGGGGITRPPDHFWFAGTAGLAILIQGSVDFAILKASVLISLNANAGAAFETGYATYLNVNAAVSVRVSVKVVFFTIHLSFSTSINYTFTIGSGPAASINGPLAPGLAIARPPPSQVQPPVLMAAARLMMRIQPAARAATFHETRFAAALMAGAPVEAVPPCAPIDVHFVLQPTVVYANGAAIINLIATLLMDCPPPDSEPLASPGAATGFEVLVVQLARWLVSFTDAGPSWEQRFEQLQQRLGQGGAEPGPVFGGFDGFRQKLQDFFIASIRLRIGAPVASPAGTAVILPMLDVLQLVYSGAGGDTSVDFGNYNPPPANYPAEVNAYFARLGLTRETGDAAPQGAVPNSMASFLVGDYFLLLCRQVTANLLAAAKAHTKATQDALVAQSEAANMAGADALTLLDMVGHHVSDLTGAATFEYLLDNYDFAGTAGVVSNFMLRGLQLPLPGSPLGAEGLYELTGQQFAVPAGVTEFQAWLVPSPSNPPGSWISFGDGSPPSATMTIGLPSPPPPMPDPLWLTLGSPDPGGIEVIRVAALPALMPVPLGWSLKNLTPWSSPDGHRTIYNLPLPLTAMIATGSNLFLRLQPGSSGSPHEAVPGRPGLAIPLSLSQVEQPSWANIPATGSPALSESGGGGIPDLYQLNGADEATRDLIEQALVAGVHGARLRLLYNLPGSDGLQSEHLSPEVLLARTNLSTLNQAPRVAFALATRMSTLQSDRNDVAALNDPEAFLRLVWELSVVQAPGFFLFYRTEDGKGLPAELFSDTAALGSSPHGSPGGRAPVPGTARGTANFTIVVEFGDAMTDIPLPPGTNCVIVDAPNDGTPLAASLLDAQGQPVQQFSPAIPPGHIAFDISWGPDTSTRSTANDIPVEELYHLMQYMVEQTLNYVPSVWSLPVGPTEAGAASPVGSPNVWCYRQTVPIYNFLPGYSPSAVNPFAAIGLAAEIGFRLIDLYGNPLPNVHVTPATPLYNDPIVTLTTWPGVVPQFWFEPNGGGSARLAIELSFDPAAIAPYHGSPAPGSPPGSPNDGGWHQAWEATRQRYVLIQQQLDDPNLHFTLQCSLSGNASLGDPKPALAAFAADIVQRIGQILQGDIAYTSPQAPDIIRIIRYDVPFQAVRALSHDIIALRVTIRGTRPPTLVYPPALTQLPAVASADCQLAANLDLHDPGSPGRAVNGVQSFALRFEAAFSGFDGSDGLLKLAQRSGVNSHADTGQVPDLWVVRWSTPAGFEARFSGDLVYYALAPLSTAPYSGMVDGKQYNGVDLDAWAQSVLLSLDGLLSPQVGVAIALIDGREASPAARKPRRGFFSELIRAKRQLAKAIPHGLAPVLQPIAPLPGDLTAARNRLEQALLVALANAFSVSTVVQMQADVTVVGSPDDLSPMLRAPELYGPVTTADQASPRTPSPSAEAQQYSLSIATLPIEAGRSWMTTLLTVANPSEQASVRLPLMFQPSFMQHDFDLGETYQGYVPSSWLKFALPGGMLNLPITRAGSPPGSPDDGVAVIPVPLPFRPQSPVLLSQAGFGAEMASPPVPFDSPPGSPDTVAAEITAALQWTYQVKLATSIAAQDQLFFDAIYNGQSDPTSFKPRPGPQGPVDALFAAMAKFLDQFPLLMPQLNAIIGPTFDPASPESGEAVALLHQIVPLVSGVADAWPTGPLFKVAAATMAREVIIHHFRLDPPAQRNGPVRLCARADDGSNPEHWPQIVARAASGETWQWAPDGAAAVQIDDWWTLTSPNKLPDVVYLHDLTLSWTPLNVMQYQSGCFMTYVERNAQLVPGHATNPAFIYYTAPLEFSNVAIPLIKRGALPAIVPTVSLHQLIDDILEPMVRLGAGTQPMVQFGCTYSYALATQSGGDGLRVPVPFLLADNVELPAHGSSPSSLVSQLARQVAATYLGLLPSTRGAVLEFTVTLFGNAGAQQMPLVQLASIPIIVSNVPMSWWRAALE